MTPEFRAWPKIPRFNRNVTITEKIDGTNACVVVTDDGVFAQSRKRLITPESDNYGFARWVQEHEGVLHDELGLGYHFGEWYGQGIQRSYGLDEKRFALFNTDKFADAELSCCEVVPVLWRGTADVLNAGIIAMRHVLNTRGSKAVPGFRRPEGMVLYHHAAQQTFKVLLEGDDVPKGVAA